MLELKKDHMNPAQIKNLLMLFQLREHPQLGNWLKLGKASSVLNFA